MQPSLPFEAPAPDANQVHAAPGRRHQIADTRHPPSLVPSAGSLGEAGPAPGTRPPQFVRHPRARRYVVRVRADGSIRVTIPRGGSRRAAEAFFSKQGAWIEKQLERVAHERATQGPEPPPELVRGLRLRAKHELPLRLLALAASHGLTVTRVSVRNQRGRWGSC
jgi:predicted metal-dependent hydrolase